MSDSDKIEYAYTYHDDSPAAHTRSKRVVTGDTPEHGKYTIWDSHTEAYAESSGGLAFAIGVAVQEAEITRDASRFWEVCHPNQVALYHVYWVGNGVAVTRIGV
jgi:hypothetical protein